MRRTERTPQRCGFLRVRSSATRADPVEAPHFAAVPFILKGARLLSTVPQPAARIFAGRFGLAASPVPVALPGIDVSLLWHASYDHDPAHQWLRGTVARLAAEL